MYFFKKIHLGVLILLLQVFHLEIYAVIIAYMVFGLAMCVMNMISVYKLSGYLPDPMKTFVLPLLSATAMAIVCFLVSFIFSKFLTGTMLNLMIVLVGFILGVITYAFGVLFTGCLDKETLIELPFGTRLAKAAEKMHLLQSEKADEH